jgi:hypothetical protein
MTLAKILLIGIFSTACVFAKCGSSTQSAQPESSPAQGTNVSQKRSTQAQPPGESKPSSSVGTSAQSSSRSGTTSSKKSHAKKKKTTAACKTPADSGTPADSAASSNKLTAADANQPPTTPNQGKDAPCSPGKIVVRQGGTTDTSIQLAGGSRNQSSQAGATANPMLDATEANLKKLEGRQLTSTEQDMVTQIRQFIEQSKTAVTAGDVERARTLAWKAQTLSEDLVKPEK